MALKVFCKSRSIVLYLKHPLSAWGAENVSLNVKRNSAARSGSRVKHSQPVAWQYEAEGVQRKIPSTNGRRHASDEDEMVCKLFSRKVWNGRRELERPPRCSRLDAPVEPDYYSWQRPLTYPVWHRKEHVMDDLNVPTCTSCQNLPRASGISSVDRSILLLHLFEVN